MVCSSYTEERYERLATTAPRDMVAATMGFKSQARSLNWRSDRAVSTRTYASLVLATGCWGDSSRRRSRRSLSQAVSGARACYLLDGLVLLRLAPQRVPSVTF